MTEAEAGLHVAVTGPTGDLGRAFLRALENVQEVERVVGMARRPFDPAEEGLTKTEYLRGDVLERRSVEALVEEADVVVHLAFSIFGTGDEARKVNLEGSRNVFEVALASARRLVYTSSVAAYGFHRSNPEVLTENVPARGVDDLAYSRAKADAETLLMNLARAEPDCDVYVLRPCIVAGPTAQMLIDKIPYIRFGEKVPAPLKRIFGAVSMLRPVVPDPGTPIQLVHEDDVAQALTLATVGRGAPGVYNLAGEGTITLTDLAHALGWYAIPLPDLVVDATTSIVSALPHLPSEAQWVNAIRVPVLMDCTKARRDLGWQPVYDTLATLGETVAGARRRGVVPWPGTA